MTALSLRLDGNYLQNQVYFSQETASCNESEMKFSKM